MENPTCNLIARLEPSMSDRLHPICPTYETQVMSEVITPLGGGMPGVVQRQNLPHVFFAFSWTLLHLCSVLSALCKS